MNISNKDKVPSDASVSNRGFKGLLDVGKNILSGKFFGKKISQLPHDSSFQNQHQEWEMVQHCKQRPKLVPKQESDIDWSIVRGSDEFPRLETDLKTIGSLSLSAEEQKMYARYLDVVEARDSEENKSLFRVDTDMRAIASVWHHLVTALASNLSLFFKRFLKKVMKKH